MLISTLLSLLFLAPIPIKAQVIVVPAPQVQLNPALTRICGCESSGNPLLAPQQFKPDGTVFRGVINSHDIGMCQINEHWNGATATAHGWDIYTTEGNIKMANWMYKNQGLAPWGWSKSCWKK
jgi:hypothetical protein